MSHPFDDEFEEDLAPQYDVEDEEEYDDEFEEAPFDETRRFLRKAPKKGKQSVAAVQSTVSGVRGASLNYPPMLPGQRWKDYYNAKNDDNFNGLPLEPLDFDIRPPGDLLMPENPDICVIIHGINANKKQAVWRVQALEMIKRARQKGYRHFYVPLVKENDAGYLEDLSNRVIRELMYIMRTPLEGHRQIARLRESEPTRFRINGRMLLIGVSNGGRIATRMELSLRRNFADSAINVVTVASPLAGTTAVRVLPSKLNTKIYGREFSEEMVVRTGDSTLAELARRAKPANVQYWHVMAEEDILVWYKGMPIDRRLVSFSNTLTIAGVPHWLVQEDERVLDFIEKAATYNPLTFPTFSKTRRFSDEDEAVMEGWPIQSYLNILAADLDFEN